jgi:DNA (cytosine-5)-methyltransferase 1
VPTVGSLFSGIGGFDLGLERAGFEIKWQVEIDEYARRVLAKHWPDIPKYGDIRAIDWSTVEPVDLLCGGFPCQDLSYAGKRAGIDGERSGLWSEYLRAICTLRPRFILVENVPGLLTNAYLGRVLGELATCGFDAEWHCIPASSIGAIHRRDRVFILAYPKNSNGKNIHAGTNGHMETANRRSHILEPRRRALFPCLPTWAEPDKFMCLSKVGGVDDGLSRELDTTLKNSIKGRLHGLGNAIVPQIAEALGRMILTSMEASHAENVLGRENVPASQSVRRKDSR